MKKLAIITFTLTIGFVSMSFINIANSTTVEANKIVILSDNGNPDGEVNAIIDSKCYGCHNSESKNNKGRKKLSFDTMDKLSIYKQIGKYEGIHEVVLESKMPPKKFLAKYPDKALTSNEKEVLIAWAKSKGEELTK